jgi:hypothetical protein
MISGVTAAWSGRSRCPVSIPAACHSSAVSSDESFWSGVTIKLAWIIHRVRCLQIQGRDDFAILGYVELLMTQKMSADRYAFGEQFGKCF